MKLLLFLLAVACGPSPQASLKRAGIKIEKMAQLGAHTKKLFKKSQVITSNVYKLGKPYEPVFLHGIRHGERVYLHPRQRGISSKKTKHLYDVNNKLLEALNHNVSLMKKLPQEMDIKQRADFFARLNPQIGIYELTRKLGLLDEYFDFPNKGGQSLSALRKEFSRHRATALDQIFIQDGQPKRLLLKALKKKVIKGNKKATKELKKLIHSVFDDIEKIGGIKAFTNCCGNLIGGNGLFDQIYHILFFDIPKKYIDSDLKDLRKRWNKKVFLPTMNFHWK